MANSTDPLTYTRFIDSRMRLRWDRLWRHSKKNKQKKKNKFQNWNFFFFFLSFIFFLFLIMNEILSLFRLHLMAVGESRLPPFLLFVLFCFCQIFSCRSSRNFPFSRVCVGSGHSSSSLAHFLQKFQMKKKKKMDENWTNWIISSPGNCVEFNYSIKCMAIDVQMSAKRIHLTYETRHPSYHGWKNVV